MLDGGEVGWGVLLPDAALVVPKHHVHDPMEPVFDAPMATDGGAQGLGIGGGRGDVKAGLALDPGVRMDTDFTQGFDHDDAVEPRPVVAFLQPGDIIRRRDDPGFDPTVALLHRLVAAHHRIGKAPRRLFREEEFDIAMEGALVALQGEDVIGTLVDDLPGDLALAFPWRRWLQSLP